MSFFGALCGHLHHIRFFCRGTSFLAAHWFPVQHHRNLRWEGTTPKSESVSQPAGEWFEFFSWSAVQKGKNQGMVFSVFLHALWYRLCCQTIASLCEASPQGWNCYPSFSLSFLLSLSFFPLFLSFVSALSLCHTVTHSCPRMAALLFFKSLWHDGPHHISPVLCYVHTNHITTMMPRWPTCDIPASNWRLKIE